MQHVRVVVLIFAALTLSACGSDQVTGIDAPRVPTLQNGGFEDGDVLPNHWRQDGVGLDGFTLSYDADGAWEGDRCVSSSRARSTPDLYAYWAQTIQVEGSPGGLLELRARIRTELSGEGVAMVIRGDNTTGSQGFADAFATTQGAVPISGSAGWAEHSLRLSNPLPSGLESITVYLVYLPNTTGSVSFDAIELTAGS